MKLLTAQDVSIILRVTPHRVYQMARQGELPAIRVGRCLRIDEVKLQAWLDRGGFCLEGEGSARVAVAEPETLPVSNSCDL
jgi:excisionase family DNA binding protein